MKGQGIKGLVLIGAHLLIAAAVVLGYETSVALVKSMSTGFSSNAQTFGSLAKQVYVSLKGMNSMVMYAILAVVVLIGYDIKLVFEWITGFRFSTKRECRNCKIRTVRAERVLLDRVLSMVFPVKRFICLGCGRQYLMANPKHKSAPLPAEAESAFARAPGADPRKVRNRFR